jgi:hypothetical protein
MFKYLMGAVIGAAALYGVLQLSALSGAGPNFKVWVNQTHIPPNNDPYDILNVQSREDHPIMVKDIVMNGDPKCVNMGLSTYTADKAMKLGEVYRFPLGIHGLNACEPVKVVITTDRGEAAYGFGE